MTQQHIRHHQPDDPGAGICPTCGCACHRQRDPDADAFKFVKVNAGKVSKYRIARFLGWRLGRLERFAARHRFDLRVQKEAEPRGA